MLLLMPFYLFGDEWEHIIGVLYLMLHTFEGDQQYEYIVEDQQNNDEH